MRVCVARSESAAPTEHGDCPPACQYVVVQVGGQQGHVKPHGSPPRAAPPRCVRLRFCPYCVHTIESRRALLSTCHTAEEVELWKKITAVGSLMVAGVFLNWLASDHQHMHTPPAYPYLRIRNKPLPWGDGTKDLLDARDSYVDGHDHHGDHGHH